LSITIFQDSQGGSRGQIMAGLCKVAKNIQGFQAAVSLMLLSKNLLFSTLGSQITKDFVLKAQVKHTSFTLNFVTLLYLIIWDAMTNLIIFYRNLHHIEYLTWISEQFFVHHNNPRSSGWIPRSNNGRALQVAKKHPRDSVCSVPDVVKQKSAFKHNWFSNNKGFCLEIHSIMLNYVKLLYLIFWDARINLIIFCRNLNHREQLTCFI